MSNKIKKRAHKTPLLFVSISRYRVLVISTGEDILRDLNRPSVLVNEIHPPQ